MTTTPAVQKVAIAGSGVAALAAAIQLAKAGVGVDVFEAKPEPVSYTHLDVYKRQMDDLGCSRTVRLFS